MWSVELDIHAMVRRELERQGFDPRFIAAVLLSQTSPGFSVGRDLELRRGQTLRVAMTGGASDAARELH
jgi:hypothetical protein